MKRFFTFIALLALPLLIVAQPKKVAVYVTGDDESISKVLGSKLVSAIARSEEYTAIERTTAFLAELSKEQSYQRTGAVDDDELSRLGKQFGVQLVCVATITKVFGEQYVSARLIDVETAQVERSASSEGSIKSLNDLMNVAGTLSKKLLNGYGSDKQKGIKKVAVYVTKNDAGKDIEVVLGDKLVTGFTNSGRYIAIERTNSFLSQISKEQNYQHTGAVDDNDIARLGKQFGVRYVCVADVTDVLNEKYISARLIDVETAEIANTYDIGGEINTMASCVRMANEIASNLSKATLAEQAKEAKIKKQEEEKREQALQTRVNSRKQYLSSMWDRGYIVCKDRAGTKWMVYKEPIKISYQEYVEGRTYSRCGYNDWKTNYLSFDVLESDDFESLEEPDTFNFIYIYNEYLHYFGRSLPLLKFGEYYWRGSRYIYKIEKKDASFAMELLDGTFSKQVIVGRRSFDLDNKQYADMRERGTYYAILIRRL